MKIDFSKLFSYTKNSDYITVKFLGIKLCVKNKQKVLDAIKIQNSYDLSNIKNTKKLIVFFIPPKNDINGGIMSIFSICKYSREICPDAQCVITTFPSKVTYERNTFFKNDEKIYRWEQIVNNAKNVKELIIHIPEYFSDKFSTALTNKDFKFLKQIENVQINILNQNIELMPEPEKIKGLYKITNNVTQTIAHDRYATQEVCDKWQIPTHFLSVHIDTSGYRSYAFEEKEKIIVLSPDEAPYKEAIVKKLKQELPDFKLITVENMPFDEYMDLIAKAYFTISFGEGFDGYFNQPQAVRGLGMAVYNSDFFPDESWLELKNVYKSPADMENNIVNDIKELSANKELYYSLINKMNEKLSTLYGEDLFKRNLEKFYKEEYCI
ncbi:MAG: hypothetical protein V8R83_05825 [Candidatus Gastranaerophilaceae bacterium]